jgi:hypothetical protein
MDVPLDVAAVALRLDMTKDAVRKAIRRGTLAARHVRLGRGRKYLVDDREVVRYIRDHRTERRGRP